MEARRRHPVPGVTGICELCNMVVGNWTLVLCKSSKYS